MLFSKNLKNLVKLVVLVKIDVLNIEKFRGSLNYLYLS